MFGLKHICIICTSCLCFGEGWVQTVISSTLSNPTNQDIKKIIIIWSRLAKTQDVLQHVITYLIKMVPTMEKLLVKTFCRNNFYYFLYDYQSLTLFFHPSSQRHFSLLQFAGIQLFSFLLVNRCFHWRTSEMTLNRSHTVGQEQDHCWCLSSGELVTYLNASDLKMAFINCFCRGFHTCYLVIHTLPLLYSLVFVI